MSNSAKADRAVRTAPVPRDRCGLALASEALGDRWTLLILREAFYGVTRFEAVRSDLGAPRAVLSRRLADLVTEGVLERIPYREEGARTRYEYTLTRKGRDLGLTLMALMEWGDRHLRDERSPVEIVEKGTGKRLRVCMATADGRIVDPRNVELRMRRR